MKYLSGTELGSSLEQETQSTATVKKERSILQKKGFDMSLIVKVVVKSKLKIIPKIEKMRTRKN
jgi:2C-methyl-D-erythritol 2,4-cyclodiphosphate synthase